MAITINETFRVEAPSDRVWSYLSDPTQVVQCVPGAEITGTDGPDAFRGRVTAKVGPVSASYAGTASLTRDDTARTLTMSANAKETTGSGSARLAMTAYVVANGEVSDVTVNATVDIVGRVMQFGRPMVDMVSKQMVAEFVTCLRTTLEQSIAPPQPQTLQPMGTLWRALVTTIRRWLGLSPR